MSSLRARFAGLAASLLVAVAALTGPLAAPASAGYTYLCWGYSGCAAKGMDNEGYSRVSGTMYWRMYAGHNCTNYVAYRMIKNGMPNVRPWSGSGNAENWGLAMASITDQTPKVGAVAWWKQYVYPAGSAGHVAYVEQVVSPTEIIVSQDSWGGDFSWARITKGDRGWPSGFVHFNDIEIRNTAAPTVSGLAKVGGTLTATGGSWNQSGVTLRYQWLADGTAISGAVAPTLTLAAEQRDTRISVRVTASKTGYPSGSATSAATDPVLPGELKAEEPPALTGTPVVDNTLAAEPGSWTPEPDALRYVWRADGERIDEAVNALELPLGAELVDKTITLTTVARRDGFDPVRVKVAAPTPVQPGTLTTTPPDLDGSPRLGETLTLQPGTAAPAATTAIRWFRSGQPVEGADGTSYRLTEADLGQPVHAEVTHSRAGYTTVVSRTGASRPVKSVTSIDLSVVPAERRGRAKVSATLAAVGVTPVEGFAKIRSGGEVLAEVPVVDGALARTVSGLDEGRHRIRVVFLGSPTATRVADSGVVRVG